MLTIYLTTRNASIWKIRGVVFGLCGGLLAPIVGSILTVISWFDDIAWHGLSMRNVGTALFALSIPSLILGAHCLDLLEKEKARA